MMAIYLNLMACETCGGKSNNQSTNSEWLNEWQISLSAFDANDPEDAMNHMDNAYALNPALEQNLMIAADKARILYYLKDFASARAVCDQIINSDQTTALDKFSAHFIIFNIMIIDGKPLEAMTYYDQNITTSPYFIKYIETDDMMILSNVPDCQNFDKIMTDFFVKMELCESEKSITKINNKWFIIKKIEAHSYMSPGMPPGVSASSNYEVDTTNMSCNEKCSFASALATGLCVYVPHKGCGVACTVFVEMVRQKCDKCCNGGNFYGKCIEPFANVISEFLKQDIQCN